MELFVRNFLWELDFSRFHSTMLDPRLSDSASFHTDAHQPQRSSKITEEHITVMIAEEQLRQISEDFKPMAALLGVNVALRRKVQSGPSNWRLEWTELRVSQHTEDIESLKKQIDEKNKEITVPVKIRKSKTKSLMLNWSPEAKRVGRLESEK